jgi:hypothetical protein
MKEKLAPFVLKFGSLILAALIAALIAFLQNLIIAISEWQVPLMNTEHAASVGFALRAFMFMK